MFLSITSLLIGIICFGFLLDRILNFLNIISWSAQLPSALESFYNIDNYNKGRKYHIQQYRLSFLSETLNFIVIISILLTGFFGFLNHWITTFSDNQIIQALLFFGILFFAYDILNLPFSVYETFVLEEKYGFNKTTTKTFILDKLKTYALVVILGGLIGAFIIWIILYTSTYFWIYAFIALTSVSFLMNYFYGTLLIPVFNKLTPLDEGELKNEIQMFAQKADFPLSNIYVMDGSKRSSRSNAFFTGFWRKKKIVLFDTLIARHSVSELVSILAHEIGHYKKKHVLIGLIISSLELLLMLFIMSKLIFNKNLSLAFGADAFALHINLIAFGILYQPLSIILGLFGNHLSRKHEFEADNFAVTKTGSAELGEALKKLSVDQLSNLTPHPAYVFFNYSHPPLLKRLQNISFTSEKIVNRK